MDLLFHVSTREGGRLLEPLARACLRAGRSFGCFFTNDGVKALGDPALQTPLRHAARAAVCEESWHRHCPGQECPVERGSQTVNSSLMGEARRVVAL